MRVIGVDLSLTSTGLAVVEDGAVILQRLTSTGRAGASLVERSERLGDLLDRIGYATWPADLVVIEGPSLGQARQGGQHDRAGLWWLLVHLLHVRRQAVAEVPPSVRAKYATGAGNVGKDAVLAAVCRRYPEADVTGNDVADALVLAAMGVRHLGAPIDHLPQAHLQAMTKVRWPDLPTPGGEQ